jgi:TPP-dependent pyruvate/acetoin dehydrogenase alpha subunit
LKNSLKLALESGNIDNLNFLDEKIQLNNQSDEILLMYLKTMIKIRVVEDKIGKMRKEELIGGPVHLGAGQEAIAVGISSALHKSDRIFSAHRSHAHLLALGSDIRRLFAELLGRSTGLTRGMGGSMHLWDQPNGFYGSVPIVAGTVSLAVGAGMAAKMQGTGDIAVSYFGDGAIEEGVVHESLNLASTLKTPVLFVCENNFFSSHLHLSQRQPSLSISRFAQANMIDGAVLDGNNVIEVSEVAKEVVNNIRNGNGPFFLEVITFRHYGHVDWREDIDVGVHRSENELKNWKKFDPILRLSNAIVSKNIATKEKLNEIRMKIIDEVEIAWKIAESDPFPKSEDLLTYLYREE